MGVTDVDETRFALPALWILRVANGSSYPTHAGVSGTPRPLRVIAVDDTVSRSRDALRRGLHEPCPSPDNEGAGNAGCLLHPRSRVQCR